MLNDYSITNSDSGHHAVPADHQHPQAREPDRRRRRAGPRVLHHGEHGGRTRPTWTGWPPPASPIQITELDIDGVAVRRRPRRRGAAAQLPPDRPGVLGAPVRRGHHGLGLAPAQPLAQRPERADRALRRHAQARRAVALQLRARRSRRPSRPDQRLALDDVNATGRRRRRPTTGPRRSAARTCARSPGGSPAATTPASSPSCPATGELTVAKPHAARRAHHVHAEGPRVRRLPRERGGRRRGRHRRTWPTSSTGAAGGTVPATLALTLGAPASFGPFTPGVAKEYTASTTATVTSTAGDAALTASDDDAGQRRVPARAARRHHAGEDELERAHEQRHVRDRVQADHRPDGAAAHRRLQHDRHLHPVDHDAMMKLRMTALAFVASAVAAAPGRGPGPGRPLPVRRDERHGRQRPVRQRPPRGRSSTATPRPSGTPDAD